MFQRPPLPAEFEQYRVTNPNFSESIRQPLYDYNLLNGAGAQSLAFFQSPIGAGVTTALGATAGTPKTLSDTNMTLAGQLPSGFQFMVEGIDVAFYPGSVNTANTYTPATVLAFNAAAAATVGGGVNDANTFYQSGRLEFTVLQKTYLTHTPLIHFVPRAVFDLAGFVASNSATTGETIGAVLRPGGNPWEMDPPIALFPAQNFDVTLRWPAAQALPSGFNARVGIIMHGYAYRAGQ